MRLIPCKTGWFAACELGGQNLGSLPVLAGLLPVLPLREAEQASLGEPGGAWLCQVAGLQEELEGWGGDSCALRRQGGVRRGW